MDKKRRHALALQALRRKYQEQKMAKIRAIAISKLSEKVTTSKNVITKTSVQTSTVTKSETVKTPVQQKVKSDLKTSKQLDKVEIKRPLLRKIKPNMCLRSFRGRFMQHELSVKTRTKRPISNKIAKSITRRKMIKILESENSSEFSSDDDQPLVKSIKKCRTTTRIALTKINRKPSTKPEIR